MNEPEQHVSVELSMKQALALEKMLRGHARMLIHKSSRGDDVPESRIDMANSLLVSVFNSIIDLETLGILGDAMSDGTFEEVVGTWQEATGDHG